MKYRLPGPLGLLVVCLLFALFPANSGAQTPLATYTAHEVSDSSVTVWADTSGFRLTWYRPGILRVTVLPSRATTDDTSRVVIRAPSPGVSFEVHETPQSLEVSSSHLIARIQKDPVRLHILKDGRSLLREPDPEGFLAINERRRVQFELAPSTRFYGTGERGIGIELRGERFRSYNRSIFGYDTPRATMNINVPLLLTSDGYGLLFDDPFPGTFDLGAVNPSRFWYEAEGGELSYYVLMGETIPAQLEQYTWLTGRPPMPPKWALGYLQSKYGYRSAGAASKAVNRLRENDIPADGLILDLYWFDHMGDLDWDLEAFPNPSEMINDFAAKGIKTIVITEPYLTSPSTGYEAMQAPGPPRPTEDAEGDPFVIPEWFSCNECTAVLADLTDPPTVEWWKEQYVDILSSGVHGLWTDLGEPEVHPSAMRHTAGSAASVHNVYNLIWADAVYNVFSEQRPNRRLVNLTRAGYAGIQRYGVFTWSADVGRTFGGLAVQQPIMLNSSLSGLYYHSSDLGGFVGQTSSELYTRWMQLGAFSPVARAHGIDNQPTEPWGFGSQSLNTTRRYLQLRYRLLPYIYTMAFHAHDRGMPLVRPLFFEAPDDPALADEDEAYLFGDDILVAPVVEPNASKKTVPLPPGTWINYWTAQAVEGGKTVTVDAPLARLPLFVREGAMIPMRPTAPASVGHSVPDTLQVAVYPKADGGAFTLYEDDGYTRDYRHGAFARTVFEHRYTEVQDTSVLEITIGPSRGRFDGQPDRRTYSVVTHRTFQAPTEVRLNGRPLSEYETQDALQRHADGYAYAPADERLFVQFGAEIRTESKLQLRGVRHAGTDVGDLDSYTLGTPSPHPVRGETSLSFRLPQPGHVTLKLYDVLGRSVATLVDSRRRRGPHSVSFSPLDIGLSSGVYFYQIRVEDEGGNGGVRYTKGRKMVVVR